MQHDDWFLTATQRCNPKKSLPREAFEPPGHGCSAAPSTSPTPDHRCNDGPRS